MKKLGARFYNAEALSNREARDLFDPSQIRIYIVDKYDSNIARPTPIRLSQGTYMCQVDEDILSNGETYNVVWVYDLHPGCPQVLRQSFIYNETPPVISGLCRIYGSIEKYGFPVAGATVMHSQIKNGYTSAFSMFNDKTVADAFGQWSLYMEQGSVGYIVIPEINIRKYFTTPSETSKSFDDITELTAIINTDSFGNPI